MLGIVVTMVPSGPAAEVRPDEWVLHVDLDQFLAAVEVLRRPELAGRPVVVGGDGNPTGPARWSPPRRTRRGRSACTRACPCGAAARRCPDAVFLPSDRPAYEEASARGHGRPALVPGVLVEVIGWDEAFLGVRHRRSRGARRRIRRRVLGETGLSCAVGIGETQARGEDRHRLRQARRRSPA